MEIGATIIEENAKSDFFIINCMKPKLKKLEVNQRSIYFAGVFGFMVIIWGIFFPSDVIISDNIKFELHTGLIALGAVLVSTTISWYITKYFRLEIKTEQETIYEKNRRAMFESLLYSPPLIFLHLKNIWKLLESFDDFDAKNSFSKLNLTKIQIYPLISYIKLEKKLLTNMLSFSECSTFVTTEEYYLIKGYVQSSVIVGLSKSANETEYSGFFYDPKTMLDNAFFAKKLLEEFPPNLLPDEFVKNWKTILNDEELCSLNHLQQRVPGDIVPHYALKNEAIFNRWHF